MNATHRRQTCSLSHERLLPTKPQKTFSWRHALGVLTVASLGVEAARAIGLEERAEVLVPADTGAILILRPDFERALQEAGISPVVDTHGTRRVGGEPSPRVLPVRRGSLGKPAATAFGVDEQAKLRAVNLAGLANDPTTLGIMGEFKEFAQEQEFKGNLFIVLDEPVAIDLQSGRVEAEEYSIAAIELTGRTRRLGKAAQFATGPFPGNRRRTGLLWPDYDLHPGDAPTSWAM